jgi:ABC-type sulfate/molybdate transport systems ATPase subunit
MDVEGRRSFWAMMRDFAVEGRTVVFATRHLEEADTVADRIVMIRKGQVVANGPAATIKAVVRTRRVRFVAAGAEIATLRELDGVDAAAVRGKEVILDSLDADATVRALVASGLIFSDLEVTGADLESAFVALTASVVVTMRSEASASSTRAIGKRGELAYPVLAHSCGSKFSVCSETFATVRSPSAFPSSSTCSS